MYFIIKVVKANGNGIMLFSRNSRKKFKMGHLNGHGRFSVKENLKNNENDPEHSAHIHHINNKKFFKTGLSRTIVVRHLRNKRVF